MTQEDKELLLKDLCGRLPYGVKVCYQGISYDFLGIDRGRIFVNIARIGEWLPTVYTFDVKPYLRPMSSMTKEERNEYHSHCDYYYGTYFDTVGSIDWLNANHFDFRYLIERGLALEAPEGMYNN